MQADHNLNGLYFGIFHQSSLLFIGQLYVKKIFIYFIFSIPTCIDYSFPDDAPEEEGLLLFGDAAGG